MKAGLKRIEATLHDLGTRTTDDSDKKPSFSFRISVRPDLPHDSSNNTEQVSQESSNSDFFGGNNSVENPPFQEIPDKTPTLPKFKIPSFSNHRHSANPGFATNILQEIHEKVVSWQIELQTIIQQIQDIYLEGPIINGWLESNIQELELPATAKLRHAEVEQLMDYVEEICANGNNENYQQFLRTDYRLCGVDTSGQLWSRPCTVEQVPSVSIAIARYQRLRQLLTKKQNLEDKLSQLVETLVVLHSHIQQS
jgi:hypothetical protein